MRKSDVVLEPARHAAARTSGVVAGARPSLVLTAQTLSGWTRKIAQRCGEAPSTAHLLRALYHHDGSVRELLFARGVTETKLLEATRGLRETDATLEVTLERAGQLTELPMGCIWGIDVLGAILRNPRATGAVALAQLGFSLRDFSADKIAARSPQQVRALVERKEKVTEPQSLRRAPPTSVVAPTRKQPQQPNAESEKPSAQMLAPVSTSILQRVAHDLRTRIPATVYAGRSAEIEATLDALGRMRSSSAMVVGESGVGKSVTLLEIARAIADTEKEAHLLEISMPALLAQTGVRGALADRFSLLMRELSALPAPAVLFFDDLHSALLGEAGDELVSRMTELLDVASVRCVATASPSALHKITERYPAFARRFARVSLNEPNRDEALAMVRSGASTYATHHQLSFPEPTLVAAVDWSIRFQTERQLPEKALALLDIAAARARRRGHTVLSKEFLAEVVASETSVPVERLLMRDREHLLALESTLRSRVVGQDEALSAIAESVRRGAAGFRGNRPLATFLFLGPTGVGKTETARSLAEHVFGANNFVRFDMSEFSEAHTIARFFGAPPGYIGHERGGELTDAVRKRPYQLVLFDEMEKAHPSVLMSLLALLDEGRVTDSKGRLVDFRNTIVVMTSNLGVASKRAPKVGFGDTQEDAADIKAQTLAACRRALPPELWNRIEEPLFFAPLSRETVLNVAAQMVGQIGASLQREHQVRMDVSPDVYEHLLASGGYDEALGARPMRRVVARLLEAPLANRVLRGEITSGTSVSISMSAGKVAFTIASDASISAA